MTIGNALRVSGDRVESRTFGWVVVAVLALLLSIPALTVGLFYDDIVHRVVLSDLWPHYHRDAWSLYEFMRGGAENEALRRVGLLPWFSEPDVAIRFFRPISSLLVALDVTLFGDAALPPHLHSLLWFGIVVALVWKIHRALLPEREAFFSSLVFVVAGVHAETLAWVSARHVLVGSAFGLGAWYALIRSREVGRAWLAHASTALLSAGFCASEATLSIVPFLLGTIWFDAGKTTRERVSRALVTLLCTAAYLIFYAAAGYGTHHVGGYVSPFDSPVRFLAAAAERIPVSLAQLFTAVPAITAYMSSTAKIVMWVAGFVAAGIVVGAAIRQARRIGERAANLHWIPLAVLASLAPVASMVIVAGRALLIPLLGASMLIGVLIARLTRGPFERTTSGLLVRSSLALLAFLHLGLGPLTRLTMASTFKELGRLEAELPFRSRLSCAEDAGVIVINAHAPGIAMYSGPVFYHAGQRERPFWHILTMAPNELELRRTGPNSLLLSVVGTRRPHLFEQLFRPSFHQLRAGERISGDAMTVTVLAASEHGPTRMSFELPMSVDSPRLCFVRWVGAERRLESVAIPKEAPLRIPYVRGPYEL